MIVSMRKVVCLLALVLIAIVLPSYGKSKRSCVSKELRLKSCRLIFRSAEYNFSQSALRIHDGVWRGIVELPFVTETTDWHTVKIREKSNKRLMEFKAWRRAASAPHLEMENLHWMIFAIEGTDLKLLADKVIRLRRRQASDNEQEVGDFLYGKLDSHMILVEKGQLLWKVGHKKGSLFPEKE